MPSIFRRRNAVIGVLNARKTSNLETIVEKSGLLVYTVFPKGPLSTKEYSEGTIAISTSTPSQYAIALLNIAMNHSGVEHPCWIIETPFSGMGNIPDARYLTGDATATSIE